MEMPFEPVPTVHLNGTTVETLACVNGCSFIDFTIHAAQNEVSVERDADYPDFTQLTPVCVIVIMFYFFVMALALSGNFMVCYVVFSNRKMHTVVNYYIVNLAVCDFMVGAFVLPFKLLELTGPAHWGVMNDGLCTSMLYLQTIFVFASVLTLVATCVERYFAILHPLESRMQQSKRRAKRILLAVWLTPCTVALPFLYQAKSDEVSVSSHYGTIHRLICYNDFSPSFRIGYYTFLFVFIYIIPLSFIGGTCFRIARCLVRGISFHRQGSLRRQEANRRKVAKMIMVVVIAYAVSWTPYFIVTIVTQYQSENFLEKQNFFFTMLCISLFAFLNSCVNPFIYAAMSSRFRSGFKRIFRIVMCLGYSKSYPPSKTKKSKVAGQYSCSSNRQTLLYVNDYSQNTSESVSQSDSGSIQHTAAVQMSSFRSIRSLVSCITLKRRSVGETCRANGVCLTGKYSVSELARIPGSPSLKDKRDCDIVQKVLDKERNALDVATSNGKGQVTSHEILDTRRVLSETMIGKLRQQIENGEEDIPDKLGHFRAKSFEGETRLGMDFSQKDLSLNNGVSLCGNVVEGKVRVLDATGKTVILET